MHTQKTVKIAFIGARGIPSNYGGYETFVEEVSQRLTKQGFSVYVTCYSNKFNKDQYNSIVRINSPSLAGKSNLPTINELISTFHLLIRCPKVDIVYYVLSYSALAAIVPKILRKKVIIAADGIEWKRLQKRKPFLSPSWKILATLASWYLRLSERLATQLAHSIIADSRIIKTYWESTYKTKKMVYITNGARVMLNSVEIPNEERDILFNYGLSKDCYYLTVCRIVPENNILMEIEGFKKSASKKKLVIVGKINHEDSYFKYLEKIANNDPNILFLGSIYDVKKQGVLRKNCFGYIHAYEVGGTNPSLVEQMLYNKPILAHDVAFHREILQDGGIYFQSRDALASMIDLLDSGKVDLKNFAYWQQRRIVEEYNWDSVTDQHVSLFREMLAKKQANKLRKA
jgi:rhamnosyltransferase